MSVRASQLECFDCRYMRNDLNRLQIRCVNAAQGCEVVCSLESLHAHEDECVFAFISCSNTGIRTPPCRNKNECCFVSTIKMYMSYICMLTSYMCDTKVM